MNYIKGILRNLKEKEDKLPSGIQGLKDMMEDPDDDDMGILPIGLQGLVDMMNGGD